MLIYYGVEIVNTAIDTAFLVLFEDEETALNISTLLGKIKRFSEVVLSIAHDNNIKVITSDDISFNFPYIDELHKVVNLGKSALVFKDCGAFEDRF